ATCTSPRPRGSTQRTTRKQRNPELYQDQRTIWTTSVKPGIQLHKRIRPRCGNRLAHIQNKHKWPSFIVRRRRYCTTWKPGQSVDRDTPRGISRRTVRFAARSPTVHRKHNSERVPCTESLSSDVQHVQPFYLSSPSGFW